MGNFKGTLNSRPAYFGKGQEYFRLKKYCKIVDLSTFNKKNMCFSVAAKEGFDKYSRKVGIFRCDGIVYASSRDWNIGRLMRNRFI